MLNAHASSLRLRLRDAGAFVRGMGVERFDVIKIDTEGAEVPIIRSLGAVLRRAAIVHIEFHSREDRRAIEDRSVRHSRLHVGIRWHRLQLGGVVLRPQRQDHSQRVVGERAERGLG